MKCDTIPDLEKFLKIQEQALGAGSSEVATTASKLAELYVLAGRLDEAEQLFARALSIQEKLVGPHHNDVENTKLSLAGLARLKSGKKSASDRSSSAVNSSSSAGNKSKASSALNNSSSAANKSSGAENKQTVSGAAIPASQQSVSGNFPASQINKQSTSGSFPISAIQKQSISGTRFGALPEHVSERTRPTFSNSKTIEDAIKETELELDLLKQMVGADHTSVADLLTKLADLYCRLRMYSKMEPVLVDALKIREAACGSNHPSVSTELKNLARLYLVQERFALAEPLFKRALAIREKAYGRMHPRVADIEEQYAHLLRKTNRAYLAETLDQHVNAIRAQHIGEAAANRKASMLNGGTW